MPRQQPAYARAAEHSAEIAKQSALPDGCVRRPVSDYWLWRL